MPGTLPPPPSVDRETAGLLRDACAAAGYTAEGLDERLGPPRTRERYEPMAVYRRRLTGDDDLATLARLFRLEEAVPRAVAERAFAAEGLERLATAGLLAAEGDRVRSQFTLTPYDGLLLLSDHVGGAGAADFVLGIGSSAETLAGLTLRQPVGAVLDLGTGGGVQALLAARHAERVVGADVNERALALAGANATLNDVSNVTWTPGSWLEPVSGQRFDQVIANPPYVVSPDNELLYRDGGLRRDELCRRLIGDLPEALADGGVAQVLCNWVHPGGEGWATPLREWVEGSGCDALLVHGVSYDPVSYAAGWNKPLMQTDASAFEQALDRWLAYYRAEGIEAIGFGLVVLRRRAGPNWTCAVEAASPLREPAGAQILQMIDAADFLQGIGDESALLDEAFRPVDGLRVDEPRSYRSGRRRLRPARVWVEPGIGAEARVHPAALDVVLDRDRDAPLRALLAERGAGDRLTGVVLEAARELHSLGLVERVQAEARSG